MNYIKTEDNKFFAISGKDLKREQFVVESLGDILLYSDGNSLLSLLNSSTIPSSFIEKSLYLGIGNTPEEAVKSLVVSKYTSPHKVVTYGEDVENTYRILVKVGKGKEFSEILQFCKEAEGRVILVKVTKILPLSLEGIAQVFEFVGQRSPEVKWSASILDVESEAIINMDEIERDIRERVGMSDESAQTILKEVKDEINKKVDKYLRKTTESQESLLIAPFDYLFDLYKKRKKVKITVGLFESIAKQFKVPSDVLSKILSEEHGAVPGYTWKIDDGNIRVDRIASKEFGITIWSFNNNNQVSVFIPSFYLDDAKALLEAFGVSYTSTTEGVKFGEFSVSNVLSMFDINGIKYELGQEINKVTFKKSQLEKSNESVKLLNRYKDDIDIKSLEYEDLVQSIEGESPIVASLKIDGQLSLFEYKEGKAKVISRYGVVSEDLPFLKEAESILKKKGVKELVAFGEEYAVDEKGNPTTYAHGSGIIKAPKSKEEEERIQFVVFDIYSMDGGKKLEDFSKDKYWKRYLVVEDLFKEGNFIKPAAGKQGGVEDIENFWEQVSEGLAEGIVLYTDDVIKVKPIYGQDLVVMGVEKSKTHPEEVGALVLAYVDDKDFKKGNKARLISAGKVGAGLKDGERKDLMKWSLKNKVDEKGNVIFVNPFEDSKIVEVVSEELLLAPRDVYKFENGKYEKVDKKLSAFGRKPRLGEHRFREDKEVNPEDLRLEQIPNYPTEEKKERKVAGYRLPDKISCDILDKCGVITDSHIRKYSEDIKDNIGFIQGWLGQEGCKVALGESKLVVVDNENVFEAFISISRKGDRGERQEGTSTPYWITDIDLEQVFKEDMYQIRQYPFMSPSSRGLDIFVDKENPREEKMHQVKWLGGSKRVADEERKVYDFRTNREMPARDTVHYELSDTSLDTDMPWFLYMKKPPQDIVNMFTGIITSLKEGKLKEITAEVVQKVTPLVAPKLTTQPGGGKALYPTKPNY